MKRLDFARLSAPRTPQALHFSPVWALAIQAPATRWSFFFSESLTMTDKSKYDLIIDDIEAVRTRNNKNWMDILRLAFRHSPDDAAAILREIYREDKTISDLAAKLTE